MIKPDEMKEARSRLGARLSSTPPATWAKLGGGLLLGGLAVGWIAFPYILDKAVAWQINLAEGKDSRKLWVRLPPVDFNLYLFNITNPKEVMLGAKPVLQEIGPYCYKEIKDKMDLVEDTAADTISYSPRTTWYDNQKDPKCKAPGLTGEEMFVVPNGALMAILLLAQKDFPPALLALVNQALPPIFGQLTDVFSRVSARRLLFDGIPIDCSARDLAPRAVCIALKQNSRPLKKLGNNKYSFSYFGPKNNTAEEFRYTVKRGTQDPLQIGRLVALDGKEELPFWRGECNKLQGTDGTVFPPFRKMENGSLAAYSGEICRTIFGSFEGVYDYKGVTGYAYSGSLGDTEHNPGDRCFCESDTKCRKQGVLDSLKCQGAPLVASQPHFYQANQDYVNGVIGLRPNKEEHGTTLVLEPISGSPLVLCKRIQFNIDLKPIQYVPLTQKLRRTLVPLFWAEESFTLDDDLMGMLEASLFRPIRAVDVLKWGSVAAGVGLAVGAAALKARNMRRDKVHVLNGELAKHLEHGNDDIKADLEVTEINGNVNRKHPFIISPRDSLSFGEEPYSNGAYSTANSIKNESKMNSALVRYPLIQALDKQRFLNGGFDSNNYLPEISSTTNYVLNDSILHDGNIFQKKENSSDNEEIVNYEMNPETIDYPPGLVFDSEYLTSSHSHKPDSKREDMHVNEVKTTLEHKISKLSSNNVSMITPQKPDSSSETSSQLMFSHYNETEDGTSLADGSMNVDNDPSNYENGARNLNEVQAEEDMKQLENDIEQFRNELLQFKTKNYT